MVALTDHHLKGAARIQNARNVGLIALKHAAELSDAPFKGRELDPPQSDAGAPLPIDGWFWSLAHTRGMVVSVTAPLPLGIDVEWLERKRWQHARDYFEGLAPEELDCIGGDDVASVLTLWAGKEAVLKRAGIGLADLARCELVARTAEDELLFRHNEDEVYVRHTTFGRHVITLAYDKSFDWEISTIPSLEH